MSPATLHAPFISQPLHLPPLTSLPSSADMVTLESAAIEFTLPPYFLRTLIQQGFLPGYLHGTTGMIHREALLQWMAEHSVSKSPGHTSLVDLVRVKEGFNTFLPTLGCTHMFTLTFCIEVAVEMAQDFLVKMYTRFSHILFGGTYYCPGKRRRQPLTLAFGEYGSDSTTVRKGQRRNQFARGSSSESNWKTISDRMITFGNNHFFHWHGLLQLTKEQQAKLVRKHVDNASLSSMWRKIDQRCLAVFVEPIRSQTDAAGYVTKSMTSLPYTSVTEHLVILPIR